MRKSLLALFTFLIFTAQSFSEPYLHNNSLVDLQEEGAGVTIIYTQPRPGLVEVGVQNGTILFNGAVNRRTGFLSGVAYIYGGECGNFPYTVSGYYNDASVLRLHGSAPIVNHRSCRVIGYKSFGPNATLEFFRVDH